MCSPGSISGVFFSYFPPVFEPKYYNKLIALNLATTSGQHIPGITLSLPTKPGMIRQWVMENTVLAHQASYLLNFLPAAYSKLISVAYCCLYLYLNCLVLRHWAGLRMSCNLSSTNSCIRLTDGRHLAEHPPLFMGSLTCPRSHR